MIKHDIIIIGAGHNGLVAAFYLAKAGFKPLVLERRDIVGGMSVTEERHVPPPHGGSPMVALIAVASSGAAARDTVKAG